ncbi:MAG: helix-turn-helix domain-containing protein [Pirellulaceae bacterium]
MAPQQATLDTPNRLLDADETSSLLNVTTGTLAVWRSEKRYDLPYVKVGRLVRYRLSDVLAWLESRTQAGI